MNRFLRLRKLRKVRRLRDQILKTNNLGRARTLFRKLPKLKHYSLGCYDEYYGSGRSVSIELTGGYTYYFGGYDSYLHYIREATNFIYNKT